MEALTAALGEKLKERGRRVTSGPLWLLDSEEERLIFREQQQRRGDVKPAEELGHAPLRRAADLICGLNGCLWASASFTSEALITSSADVRVLINAAPPLV